MAQVCLVPLTAATIILWFIPQQLVNSNKVIPATQAHECRLKTNRSQVNSLSLSRGEEMPWGQVLVMAVTTSDSIVRNPFLALQILDSAQTLSSFGATFHPKSSERMGYSWKLKITCVITLCVHIVPHQISVLHLPYLDWSDDNRNQSQFTSPIPSFVLRPVRPTLDWRGRESGWNKKICACLLSCDATNIWPPT